MKTKFFVTIIVLLSLCMGGLLIYDRYFREPEGCGIKNCDTTTPEIKYPYESLDFGNDVQRVLNLTGDAEISIRPNGVYLTLYESQLSEENVKTIYTNLMANGDIKLDLDNVVFAYPLNTGFTIYANYFAFLHNDGTISVLSMGEIMTSGVVEVKKIDGLSKIINIYLVESQGDFVGFEHKVIAVDVNGKKHEINMPLIDQW